MMCEKRKSRRKYNEIKIRKNLILNGKSGD
jgi:hypothetical protein